MGSGFHAEETQVGLMGFNSALSMIRGWDRRLLKAFHL